MNIYKYKYNYMLCIYQYANMDAEPYEKIRMKITVLDRIFGNTLKYV